jgi:hypothetical protein
LARYRVSAWAFAFTFLQVLASPRHASVAAACGRSLEIPTVLSRRFLPRLVASLIVPLTFAAAPSTGRGEMVYVTSFSTGELDRFDSADPVGTKTTLLAPGTLAAPTGLAFGSDGNLYIGTSGDFATVAPTIARYDVVNNTLSTAYTFASFDTYPAALAFKGNDLLVGRNPFAGNTGPIVQLANIIGGSPLQSDYTSGLALASSPGLALAGDGTLYVSNQTYVFGSPTGTASGPVERFDATGTYVNQVIADGASGLAGPTGLAIAGNTLYTSSIMNGTILVTDLTNDSTSVLVDTTLPYAVGPLAVLSNGNLLAGDPSGAYDSIFQFDSSGTPIGSYPLGLGQVGGITVAPVPEPGTVMLLGMGFVAGAALLRRRRRATITA